MKIVDASKFDAGDPDEDLSFPPPVRGTPMMEVFAVRVNNIGGNDSVNVYGKIDVNNEGYIYNVDREDAESINFGGTDSALISLTGPPSFRCLYALTRISIELALRYRDVTYPDLDLSTGFFYKDPCMTTKDNEIFSREVSGKYGSVTVFYALFLGAVKANLEVTLTITEGDVAANIYGVVSATNTKLGSSCESMLFRKNLSARENVRTGDFIPLSKSVLALPSNSNLIVRADLYSHSDRIPLDNEIANDTAIFPAEMNGSAERTISGKHGEIRVKVSWMKFEGYDV